MKAVKIDQIVCDIYGITLEKMYSKSHKRLISDARKTAMYYRHFYLKESSLKLARAFGKKTHTTILFALKNCRDWSKTSPEFRDKFERIGSWIEIQIQTENHFRTIKQRYNMNYRMRRKGFNINYKSRTLILPAGMDIEKNQQTRLSHLGYAIQFSLL